MRGSRREAGGAKGLLRPFSNFRHELVSEFYVSVVPASCNATFASDITRV